MLPCQSIAERNCPSTLCQMTLKTTQNEPRHVIDNYLTLDEPLTQRVVGCQTISPGFYPDMTQPMIGKRPVYSARNCEYTIPAIIIQNRDQFVNKRFNCYQPTWT